MESTLRQLKKEDGGVNKNKGKEDNGREAGRGEKDTCMVLGLNTWGRA